MEFSMWFKQFSWYNMQSALLLEGEALEEALSQKQAYKPHATQNSSIGWISPLGEGHPLAVTFKSFTWLAVRIDRKLLPASVIQEVLLEQLKDKEQEQGYPVSNKQKRVMKEEITLDLLPKAFVQSKRVQIVIDSDANILMIDNTSAQVKDAIVELLRQTVGSCPMTHHMDFKASIAEVMKDWVVTPPASVEVEPECTLIQPNNVHAKARVAGLDPEMIVSYIDQGMTISQLMLQYQGKLRFQLNDQLDVSRIKCIEMDEEEPLEDPIEQMMTDFSLWVPYYIELISQFKEWFPMLGAQPAEQSDEQLEEEGADVL